MNTMNDINKCKQCGDTAPEGKDLCWCCEHDGKLHPMTEKPCKDSCDIGGTTNATA